MLRNEEFRSVIIKLVVLQLIFILISFIMMNLFMDTINNKILERDMALVGNIIKDHPELKEEFIPYITKEVPRDNRRVGQLALKDYGYTFNMKKYQQPLLKNISPNIQIFMSLLVTLFLVPLIWLISKEYKKIYKKVNKISNAAEKVVEGDFSIYLPEEGEGDFYILNHQFNQMANRLKNSLDILNREKIFLKDTISDISHQLKTPLSSLIMLNDLLIEDEHMDLNTRKKFLKNTSNQLERMEWLIINLLKVARIEAGAIEFKKEKVFLKNVVDLGLNILGPKIEGQELNISGNLDSFFYGDRDWTVEAVINIVKNAIEHGHGQIDIILSDTPLFSSIAIRDNGDGIDKKHIPHIFKRFYRASGETNPESVGIGLNLAKVIVESQGGTISVISKKGVGTEFTITFLKTICI